MPQGFKFTTPEEVKKGIKRPPIPQIQPDQEDSTIIKILTGQPLLKLGEEAQFEHGIKNRRLGIPEFDPTGSQGLAGTTKYLNAWSQLPNIKAREWGTTNFLDKILEMTPSRFSGLRRGAEALISERKKGGMGAPKVAAHMTPYKYTRGSEYPKGTSASGPELGKRFEVEFNTDPTLNPNDMFEAVFREAAGAAQRLGNPNVDRLTKGWKQLYGNTLEYPEPFELSRNIIARRRMEELKGIPRKERMKPVNALKMYEDTKNSFGPDSVYRAILEEAMKRY